MDLDWTDVDAADRPMEATSAGAPAARPPAPSAPAPVALGSSGAPVVDLDDVDFSMSPAAVAAASPAASSKSTQPAPIELPEVDGDDAIELAPAVEFVPPASDGGPGSSAGAARAPVAEPAIGQASAPVAAPRAGAAPDGGEAALRAALSQASRDVIEKIAWEVVPQLAETILREQIDRLVKERQR